VRIALRWKILLITVITPLSLGLAAFATVNRNVQKHVDSSSIQEALEHSIRVFEAMLATRGRALSGGAEVIALDPRFFSLLTLGTAQRDSRFTATVRGMARDFNRITQTELFEVFDRQGRSVASVGAIRSSPGSRAPYVRRALKGEATVSVIVERGLQYQVSTTPVRSDGRVVGVLMLGSEVGQRLARTMRGQMRCEVSFVSGGAITSTTLEDPADRRALLGRVARALAEARGNVGRIGRLDVKGADLTYITVLQPMPGSDPAEGKLYVMQRASDPEMDFLHLMQRDLVLLAVIGVVAALLTGLMLSRSITRPIHQLVLGARAMQQGDYSYPVPVHKRDEIGFLAERFAEMRQRSQVYVGSLEEAARLKSEFITVASHELRTPISVIQGYQDLLEAEAIGPIVPAQQQALKSMRQGLQRLAEIADQAVLVAQVQSKRLELNRQWQALGPILDRSIGAALADATTRKVRVEATGKESLEPLAVDGGLLSQAIINLISNGIRFTPDGGLVKIEAREHGTHAEILIWDQGPGIAKERLGHLFDHGYSIQNVLGHHSSSELEFNSRGLGLGLGITRGIIEAHGGTVTASNREEGGTVFQIRLPRLEASDELKAA
jgi:signal transduction histidine kinase